MSIDSSSSNQAASTFSISQAKTEIKLLAALARILAGVFTATAAIILAAAGSGIDNEPTARIAVAVSVVLAGLMLVGIGGLRAHLLTLRAIEQLRGEERENGQALGVIADAAVDRLGQRRNGG